MDNCIFCKIRDKQIPKDFMYDDEDVMVFPDISPAKPIHLLIIPKKHVADFLDADPLLLQKLSSIVQQMVKREGLTDKGYRVLVNGGGAQIVHHLHIHLLGPMGHAVKN